MSKYNLGVACLVDKKNNLKGIITDGDIRRALLKGYSLEDKVSQIMRKNFIAVGKKHL